MHGSVLQNEKYIEFAEENTVEVIALGELQKGIDKGDPKAAEFDDKDDEGNPVKRMFEYPSLTKDEMLKLATSPAAAYNDTGRIPFTCLVNPHDLKEMQRFPGGQSAKTLMEAALLQKKRLNEQYGPSLSRATLKKFDAGAKKIADELPKSGAAKAMVEYRKLEKSLGKEVPAGMKERTEKLMALVLEAATKELDDAEAAIDSGDVGGGKKILAKLAAALKGTSLEARVGELNEKAKAAAPAPEK